jgi:hypothetical protein
MTRVLPALLAAVLVGPATSAPRPKDKAPPATYWPTEVGATFEYQSESGGSTTTRTVAAVERVGSVTTVTMTETGPDGQVKPSTKVEIRSDGLYLAEEFGQPYDPPVCLLQTPVKQGQRWTTASKWRDASPLECVREVGESKVLETPAGRFEAVRLTVEVKSQKHTSVFWYAPEAGIVSRGPGRW